jgi:hypothetical protein
MGKLRGSRRLTYSGWGETCEEFSEWEVDGLVEFEEI